MSQGRIDLLKNSGKIENTSKLDPMFYHPLARQGTQSNLLANSIFTPVIETGTEQQIENNASPEFKRPT